MAVLQIPMLYKYLSLVQKYLFFQNVIKTSVFIKQKNSTFVMDRMSCCVLLLTAQLTPYAQELRDIYKMRLVP
jgi:hypothetical protein